MISDGCSDANGKVLVKHVSEHLQPTAQGWRLAGTSGAAPGTGNRHIDMLGRPAPGQAWSRSSRICCVEAGCDEGAPRRIVTPHGEADGSPCSNEPRSAGSRTSTGLNRWADTTGK